MANLQFVVDAETRAATAKLGAFAQDLQKTLTQAIRKLPDLEITADSSDAQKAVAQLRSEMSTLANKKIGIDISAADALAETQRLQTELRQLASTTTEVQVGADARAAAAALGDVEAQARRLSGEHVEVAVTADTAPAEGRFEGFKTALKAGAMAAGAAAGALMSAALATALDIQEGNQKLQAQFGLTAEQAKVAGDAAGRVFSTGLVTTMEEARVGVSAVGRALADLGTSSVGDLERLSGKALLLADTFNVDVTEAANAAGRMIKAGLADNADHAFDLIAKGFQNGANQSDDFLASIQEYSPMFSRVGLDGQQAFGMLAAAQKAGLRDTDTWADAIKEFSLLVVEKGGTASEAFTDLGMNADKMAQEFGKGGQHAAEAMSKVVTALVAIKDPIRQNEDGVRLFGTTWEDTVRDILPTFDPMQNGLGDVAGTMDTLNETTTTSTQKVQKLQNQFTLWLGSLVDIKGPVGDIAAGLGAFGPMALSAVGAIAPLIVMLQMKGVATAVGGASTAVGGLGAAGAASGGMFSRAFAGIGSFLFNPLTLAIGAAAAITLIWADDQAKAAARVAEHKAAVDKLSGTLDQYTGAVTGATAADVAKDFASRKLADGTTSFGAALKGIGISMSDYTAAATGNDQAMAKVNSQLFVQTQSLPKVQAMYQNMKGELDRAGVTWQTFTAAMMGNGQALEQVSKATGTGIATLQGNFDKAGGAARELSMALGDVSGTLKEAQDQTRTAGDAVKQFDTILKAITPGLAGLRSGAEPTKAMADEFKNLAESSGVAALRLGEAAAATGGLIAGAQRANESMAGSRAAFLGAAEGAGIAHDRAVQLADSIGLIPLKAETQFILNANTDPATQKVTAVVQMADGSKGTVTLDGNPTEVNGKIQQAITFADGSHGTVTIDGNKANADGSVNAVVTYANGSTGTIRVNADVGTAEYEINRAARDRTSTIYVNSVELRESHGGAGGGYVPFAGGGVLGYATGGPVHNFSRRGGAIPGYAPGVDNVPAVLSKGEAVLVPELVRRIGVNNIMKANAEASGGRPGTLFFSSGGVVAPKAGDVLTVEQAKAGYFQHADGSYDNLNAPKWDHPGLGAWKKAMRAASIEQASQPAVVIPPPTPPAGGGLGGGTGTTGPVEVIDQGAIDAINGLLDGVSRDDVGRAQLGLLGALLGAFHDWRPDSSSRCEDSRRRSTMGAW